MPIKAGDTPTTAVHSTRINGVSSRRCAVASDMTTIAAAPSLIGALVAAVTLPSFGRNTGFSFSIAAKLAS